MAGTTDPVRIRCSADNCGQWFTPRKPWQRYHSLECGREQRRRNTVSQRPSRPWRLDDPDRIRADIQDVLNNPTFWLTDAYTVAIHAERLLDRLVALRETNRKANRAYRTRANEAGALREAA